MQHHVEDSQERTHFCYLLTCKGGPLPKQEYLVTGLIGSW